MRYLFYIGIFLSLNLKVFAQQSPQDFYQRVELSAGTQLLRGGDRVRLTKEVRMQVTGHRYDSNGRLIYRLGSGEYEILATNLESILPGCNIEDPNKNRSDLRRVARKIEDETFQALNPRHSPNPGRWAANCYNFIQSDGSIGAWGTKAIEALNTVGVTCLYSETIWRNLCPNFGSFSQKQKDHFLVYFIATKAMDESSCNPRARAWAENGWGVGLFALEESEKLRGHRGRWCNQQPASETRDLTFQFQCTMSQIQRVQCNAGVAFGESGGYWQEANSMRGDISKAIVGGYAACSN